MQSPHSGHRSQWYNVHFMVNIEEIEFGQLITNNFIKPNLSGYIGKIDCIEREECILRMRQYFSTSETSIASNDIEWKQKNYIIDIDDIKRNREATSLASMTSNGNRETTSLASMTTTETEKLHRTHIDDIK